MAKKIVALNGSPRPAGNTTQLLNAFAEGAGENSVESQVYTSLTLNLKDCTGCLRCNVLKRCAVSGDEWAGLSTRILESDVLVFASPIYFHHLPASLKRVLDRFRSFAHVQISETGLVHTPHQEWKKDFVLILTMGSPHTSDAQPVIDLFRYICSIMGPKNRLHVITGTRLGTVNHVIKNEDELLELYRKLKLPEHLAGEDYVKNRELMEQCRRLGRTLSTSA
jgi:multimeric flavodoxin WrbA